MPSFYNFYRCKVKRSKAPSRQNEPYLLLYPTPIEFRNLAANLIQDDIVDSARLPRAHLTLTNRRVLIRKPVTLSLVA